MNFDGLIIGFATFAIIGVFHPIVIKAEYWFGTRCWWAFALVGAAGVVGALVCEGNIGSAICGVVGFSSFWSIGELFKQRERVRKGWFPKRKS